MTRDEELLLKARELQDELRRNGQINTGEMIVIELFAERDPVVRIEPMKRGTKEVLTDHDIGDADWDLVLSQPWTSAQADFLQLIRANGNQATALSGEIGVTRGRINREFARYLLPYQLRLEDGRAGHPRRPVRLFRTRK